MKWSVDAMSVLFRKQGWLTVAQLTRAWGRELAKGGEADQHIQDLGHILLVDILNGRLDDSGPLVDDQRSGLRLITPENKAGFIKGHHVRDLLDTSPISLISHHIIVMKEAALDFARRHKVPAPSWWTEEAPSLSPASGVTSQNAHSGAASPTSSPSASTRRGGRRPKKLDQAKEAMRSDIREGRLTRAELRDMLEKNLAEKYEVSRDTARKAREAVLSEVPPTSETQFPQ
jgi:hypothetical protein